MRPGDSAFYAIVGGGRFFRLGKSAQVSFCEGEVFFLDMGGPAETSLYMRVRMRLHVFVCIHTHTHTRPPPRIYKISGRLRKRQPLERYRFWGTLARLRGSLFGGVGRTFYHDIFFFFFLLLGATTTTTKHDTLTHAHARLYPNLLFRIRPLSLEVASP